MNFLLLLFYEMETPSQHLTVTYKLFVSVILPSKFQPPKKAQEA